MSKPNNRKDYCFIMADRIHKVNPSLRELENTLNDVYEKAYTDGYKDAHIDSKKLREARESLLKRGWNELRDAIEDKINSNK